MSVIQPSKKEIIISLIIFVSVLAIAIYIVYIIYNQFEVAYRACEASANTICPIINSGIGRPT